jgi:hypothetical protein
VGVELFSDRIDAMTAREAGRQVSESLHQLLESVPHSTPSPFPQ